MKRVMFALLLAMAIAPEVQAQTWLHGGSNSSRQDGYVVLIEIIRFMAAIMPQLLERLDEHHVFYFLSLVLTLMGVLMAVLAWIVRNDRKK